MGPAQVRGSCEGGNVSTHWEVPSRVEAASGGGGKLRSQGGECSNRGAEGKVERFPHRGAVRPALTSQRGLSAHPPGRAGAGS